MRTILMLVAEITDRLNPASKTGSANLSWQNPDDLDLGRVMLKAVSYTQSEKDKLPAPFSFRNDPAPYLLDQLVKYPDGDRGYLLRSVLDFVRWVAPDVDYSICMEFSKVAILQLDRVLELSKDHPLVVERQERRELERLPTYGMF